MNSELNTRILVVDDEEFVREGVRSILCPRHKNFGPLDTAADQLFGHTRSAPPRRPVDVLTIDLDEAANGRKAYEMVRAACAAEQPYALVLLDMRMPGWDGLTTAERIRKVDRQVEILFITAHSDHSIQAVVERAGPDVGYLCKPFVNEELHQLAIKSIYEWNRLRNLESLIRIVSKLRISDGQLETLLHNIFEQAIGWLGAQSAMLVSYERDDEPRIRFSTGSLKQAAFARECLEIAAPLRASTSFSLVRDLAYFPFERCALIVHQEGGVHLSTERTYLFLLFLEHSTQAVENARLHQALVDKEKLSALGQAMGYVVHDLRSPIGAIVNSTELLRYELGEDSESRELLDIIEEAADNAIAVVDDVLDFTREGIPSRKECEIAEVLGRLERSLEVRVRECGVNFRVTGPREGSLLCDPRKVHRALENLAVNALDAVASSPTSAPAVWIEVAQEADEVRFLVCDNGPGIAPTIMRRLFEPFATAGKENGTGLGLAIVKQIVTAHGGSITVDSSSAGTSFVVTLPRR